MITTGPDNRLFPETGQYISDGFKAAWEALEKLPATDGVSANIAMQCVGYPIAEPRQETIGTWTGTVQYFERARMEWHNDKVQLGLLGAELLAKG